MFTQPLVIGSTYRLKFKSPFEQHGVCTTPGVTCLHPGGGVFRLEQITNFRDLVLAGIKLYDVFFKPLGISEEKYRKYFDGKPDDEFTPEYTTTTVANETEEEISSTDSQGDLIVLTQKKVTTHEIQVETGRSLLKKHYRDTVDYASYPLYKFVDATDSNDILWVPELTIDTFPEIDIREYKDLSLVVHLGYTHDPTTLDPMLLSIRERMAAYGWRPSLVKLYVTDSKWMSPSEYDGIKKTRVPATIETITSEDRTDTIGRIAIVNGMLKKIVLPAKENPNYKWLSSVNNPEEELCIDAIQKQSAIIDNRLFLVKCKDGETYVTGDSYYVQKQADSHIYLQCESTDFREDGEFKSDTTYHVKNALNQFVETTDTTRYPEVSEATKAALGNIPDPSVVYYVVDGSLFRLATSSAGDFPGGKFESGRHYYTRSETKYFVYKQIPVAFHKLLVEGVDYTPGEPCVEYRLAAEGEESLQHYYKIDGGYSVVAYGHHSDYSADVLMRKLHSITYNAITEEQRTAGPQEGTTYYIRVEENVYRPAVAEDFTAAGQFVASTEYYLYISGEDTYRAATEEEIADPIQVLYVKQPDTYSPTATTTAGKTYIRVFVDQSGQTYSTVYRESYSTVEALSLMGYKFDYEDVFGNSKTLTLQLEDIIESASQTMNVVLPDASFDYDTFWKRFENRKFRYENHPDDKDPTVTETIDIVISEETRELLSLKAGMLLGQSGQISKETYIKDDDQQKRNYYMRYVIQSKALEDKTNRVSALEQALVEKQANFDATLAEKDALIAQQAQEIEELKKRIAD